MSLRSVLRGCGSALPKTLKTNHDLSKELETTHEWIVERTGIHQRYLAGSGETTSTLATLAAQNALSDAGLDPKDIDGVIVGTVTPDVSFPSVATMVQANLGIPGFGFDLSAACAGFLFALSTADSFIRSGQAKRMMVIGADTLSRTVDWTDRSTAVLFGDGAGAVILEAQESTESGILSCHLHSDGRHHDILYVDGGPSKTESLGKLRMEGREVFKHAVQKLSAVATEALSANGYSGQDLDWLVPHQANSRIIEATAKHLGLPMDKVILTVQDHANTSAASIPLALDRGYKEGKIKPGNLVLMEAIGGGLAWGSALIRI